MKGDQHEIVEGQYSIDLLSFLHVLTPKTWEELDSQTTGKLCALPLSLFAYGCCGPCSCAGSRLPRLRHRYCCCCHSSGRTSQLPSLTHCCCRESSRCCRLAGRVVRIDQPRSAEATRELSESSLGSSSASATDYTDT